ncbi:hypothetical protein GCM10022261_18080 [Brevibacterium daeguense]|uniref:Inositol-phosphate phosphatase n=1 Tax=Brevibacterium daeguense TaxID=909936 RepID=A0ABP8EK10_9MICO
MNAETFLADPLLVVARDAAAVACARMEHWRSRLADQLVDAKDNPNDLVTIADSEIESLVTGYLRRHRPDDIVVGEEGAEAKTPADVPVGGGLSALLLNSSASAGDPDSRIEWHVDPIDGTVNFVRGMEHHCFSIGGRDASTGEWVIGLVAAPQLRTVWFARSGLGAWKAAALPQPGGTSEFVRLRGTPPARRGRVVATGFSYTPERREIQFADLVRVMDGFDDIRRAGSAAIDLCLAAEGRVNAYYERGLGIYDWAAGALIAEEAGLQVLRPVEPFDPMIAADTAQRFEFIRSCL